MRAAGEEGLEASRVAEVLVAGQDGPPGRRGSGYRVGDRWVLTAAHVVAGREAAVRVRFDADLPGEWDADARVVLCAPAADVALLEIMAVPDGRGAVEPPRYAAVPDADVVLAFSAMGFPRFKLREDAGDGAPGRYRDSCHVAGSVSVLSNRREGTLELAVAVPPGDSEPHRSPWEGMSGALVWCGGAVIGMVSAHHRSDGLGRLAAGRVERWYDALDPAELALLRRCAGLPPREALGTADGSTGRRPVTGLAGLPPDLPLRELAELVDALTAVPVLRGGNGMGLVLDGISDRVAANSPRDPRLRMDVYGIVRTCLRYPGTLDQLLEALRLLEGPSVEMDRVDDAAARLARRCG
ncbi:trypsin-like peptidase domain-containing protein [Streptomyces sp. NEAU-sy36]|uniref:effector-associated domain 2-containing protein n=1 Tax=unclassified Streptomyces TaxID=2593676 RepID=UPI0015D5BA08|nr:MULTISPECIES: trypsin-like peptidase domain-containing protein [unclassified Streptomyces]QLJ03820.1 trypsin-like peptidase domain-containing protein [Streptomyces sp. NEAU-sy36]